MKPSGKEAMNAEECNPHPEGGLRHLYRFCSCDIKAFTLHASQVRAEVIEEAVKSIQELREEALCVHSQTANRWLFKAILAIRALNKENGK